MINDLVRSSKTHAQFIRYFFVAGVGLVIDFSAVIFSKEVLGLYYLIATSIGFILGLIVTYTLSNKYVFGTPKDDPWKAFLLFGIIGLVGLGILSLAMWVLTGMLGLNYILSKALATIVVFVWNFFARKTLYDNQDISLPYEL